MELDKDKNECSYVEIEQAQIEEHENLEKFLVGVENRFYEYARKEMLGVKYTVGDWDGRDD